MNKKLKAILNFVIYSVIYFIILYSVLGITKHLLRTNEVFTKWFFINQDSYVVVNDIISLVLFFFLVKFTHKKNIFEQCKFKKVNVKSITVLSLVGLCVGLFTTSVLRTPIIVNNVPVLGSLLDSLFGGSTIICFLLFLTIGSIYKEILFRGIYFNDLKEIFPFTAAVIIQGFVYGIYFFQTSIPLILAGAVGAILFALLYTWFDSIWAPTAVEITSTLGMFLLYVFRGNFINNNIYLFIIVSFIGIVGGIYYLLKNKHNLTYQKKITENKSINA